MKTINGGNTWTRTQSNPVSDSLLNFQNHYDGLWVDTADANRLVVTGDAFAVVARSTDGGASWSGSSPDAFNQGYYFPPNTGAPYGTKLAVFEPDFLNNNTGHVGLSYGRLARTTNGGSSWTVKQVVGDPGDSTPVWFNALARDTSQGVFEVGTQHVIVSDSIPEHNLGAEAYPFGIAPLTDIGFSAGGFGYAVGSGDANSILQRYDPAELITFDIDDSASIKIVRWITFYEDNTDYWGLEFHPMEPVYTGANDHVVEAHHNSGGNYTVFHTYTIDDCQYYWVTLKLYTDGEAQWNPPFQVYAGPVRVEVGLPDTLLLPSPALMADDHPGDQGGAIDLHWTPVPNAVQYNISRSENYDGPFYVLGAGDTITYTYHDTWGLVNGKRYYYQITAYPRFDLAESIAVSPPASASAVPLDNLSMPAVNNLVGTYLRGRSMIRIAWDAPAGVSDLAGYWICPDLPGLRYQLAHAAPIDRNIYYWPLADTTIDSAVVAAAAMDYSGHISSWSSFTVPVMPAAGYSTSACATGLNNSRKMLFDESTQLLHALYADNNKIVYCSSCDEGVTWSEPLAVGSGVYPALAMTPDLDCIWPA